MKSSVFKAKAREALAEYFNWYTEFVEEFLSLDKEKRDFLDIQTEERREFDEVFRGTDVWSKQMRCIEEQNEILDRAYEYLFL